jgi:hypothetical protein
LEFPEQSHSQLRAPGAGDAVVLKRQIPDRAAREIEPQSALVQVHIDVHIEIDGRQMVGPQSLARRIPAT